MFKNIRTSEANRKVVTELTQKLSLGPENVIARLAFAYSLARGQKLELSSIKDAKGKEYSQATLFGNYTPYYIAMVSQYYGLHKENKDIQRYVKLHIDDGLELMQKNFKGNPNQNGFEFILENVEAGLTLVNSPSSI